MFIPKNQILYAVGGLAFLAIGIFIGSSFGNKKETLPVAQTAAVSNSNQPSETSTTQSPPSVGFSPSTLGEMVRVVRVVDGDTINVEINGKVEPLRYIGIDTPETVDPRKPVQCFGVEASKKNKELVDGKMVRLEKDITDRDKYKRLLRYVWLGDTLINEMLVSQGYATSYSYPPDVKYQDRFVEAEKQARDNKLGLWTACASASASVPPATPTTQAATANPSCTIKGNISASGEKIYHMQGCGSYTKRVNGKSVRPILIYYGFINS